MKTRTAFSLLFVSAALIASGGLFKVLHWPSANIQLLAGPWCKWSPWWH